MTDAKPGTFKFNELSLMSFPSLVEPTAVKRNGKPTGDAKYSVNIEPLNTQEVLKAAKVCAASVAKARWPGRDIKAEIDAGTFGWPFANGDMLANKAKAKAEEEGTTKFREWSRGRTVLTARSKFRPRLAVLENGRAADLVDEAVIVARGGELFYSGVEGLFTVTFEAYDAVGNGTDGVNAYIDSVLSVKRGTRLTGGARSAADEFKEYIGTIVTEDPTTGMAPAGVSDATDW